MSTLNNALVPPTTASPPLSDDTDSRALWRLRVFYAQLDASRSSELILQQHRQQLEAWITARPESITPRVWSVRGNVPFQDAAVA